MVEVCRHGEAFRQYVRCREIDVERVGAACGLGVVFLYAAYKSAVVLEREVGVESQVVAYARLRAFHLQHGVESHYFVAGADGNAALCRFDHLPGGGVEREGAPL